MAESTTSGAATAYGIYLPAGAIEAELPPSHWVTFNGKRAHRVLDDQAPALLCGSWNTPRPPRRVAADEVVGYPFWPESNRLIECRICDARWNDGYYEPRRAAAVQAIFDRAASRGWAVRPTDEWRPVGWDSALEPICDADGCRLGGLHLLLFEGAPVAWYCRGHVEARIAAKGAP